MVNDESRFSTIRGIAESIVALPYQLGYRPERSLVMVCLDLHVRRGSGPTGVVSLTARADLDPPGGDPAVLESLSLALHRAAPDAVLLIAYEDDSDDATSLLWQAQQMALREGVQVDRAVRVREGSWRPLAEPDGSVPRWHRLPAPGDVPVVADYVLSGRSPWSVRSDLARLFEPTRPLLCAAVAEEARRRIGTSEVDAEAAMGLLAEVLRSAGQSLPTLAVGTVTDLVLALHDVHLRDAVLARTAPGTMRLSEVPREHAGVVLRLLPQGHEVDTVRCQRLAMLAATVPAPLAAPLLTVCGYLAWSDGDGTMANLAVERALGCDPDYSLARLLDQALLHAVRPPRTRGAEARRGRPPRPAA